MKIEDMYIGQKVQDDWGLLGEVRRTFKKSAHILVTYSERSWAIAGDVLIYDKEHVKAFLSGKAPK